MPGSESPTLAGPPGDCCFTTVKHTGDPVGRKILIADVPTYISEPPQGTPGAIDTKKIILFFADVWGPFFPNNQLLQDYFASHGYIVLGVDYFFGDAVYIHEEPDFDRQAWIEKAKLKAAEAVPRWLEAVKKQYGTDAKYNAVGYCFGGPYALNLATTDEVVAAAFAHPAFLNEDHFNRVKKPFFLSLAETDHTFPLESRRRAEDILISIKAKYQIQVHSGVSHGFAVRADLSDENARWAKEESARGIVGWFDRFSNVQKAKI